MYVRPNYKTKKALAEAVKAGTRVEVFSAGLGGEPEDGERAVEGPHFPQAHSFYARVVVKDGIVVRVLK